MNLTTRCANIITRTNRQTSRKTHLQIEKNIEIQVIDFKTVDLCEACESKKSEWYIIEFNDYNHRGTYTSLDSNNNNNNTDTDTNTENNTKKDLEQSKSRFKCNTCKELFLLSYMQPNWSDESFYTTKIDGWQSYALIKL